jgi:signal-transduction protein with cAMP-binding, CBS, and nucleotidyltransferase domain
MKSQRKWKHGKSNVEKVRRKEEARAINVHDAAATMASKHIRKLSIARDGKLVGIIRARDLARAK